MRIREYIQWLLPSRKQKMLAIIITGMIVGGRALTLYILRAHTYLTDDSAACVNCHIMGPYYVTWFHSSHSGNATCNDCHVPHKNVVKEWVFKGMDGMRHTAVFLTHGEKDVVRVSGESSEMIMNSYIRYHTQLSTEFVSTGRVDYMMPWVGEGKACWDCHRDISHGGSSSVASTPSTLIPYPDSPTPEWLRKMIE